MSDAPTKLSQLGEFDDRQLAILHRITRLLNRAVYQDALLDEVLQLVVEVVNAERGLVVRHDARENGFHIVAARNVKREKLNDLSAFSSGILEQVIADGKPCLYHDVQSDPKLTQFESVVIHQIKSVIGVPIFSDEEIWGVILVDSQMDRKEFTEENLTFLDFFANLVSLALDKILRFEALEAENAMLRNQLTARASLPNLVGESTVMHKLASTIERVAKSGATVLLLGESGTGKDLVARAIHDLSPRAGKPYLAQFCGSIPETLLESELFGYRKGAFSGATSDKKGLFEVADNGTFFLDEIADIPMSLQAKLLRVLQNQEIIRLGDTKVKKVNVRIVAATNKDLQELAKNGEFREDLFYRLNVFPVRIPPLRDRDGDVALLADHFLDKYSDTKVQLGKDALKKLQAYSWPGNVRQLENIIQRALILAGEEMISADHIILEDGDPNSPRRFQGTLKEFERKLLLERLKKFDGNRTRTAESLGVSVRWVQLKLKEIDDSEAVDG